MYRALAGFAIVALSAGCFQLRYRVLADVKWMP
jgi:hypothetical protein